MESGRINSNKVFTPSLSPEIKEAPKDHKEEIIEQYVESGKKSLSLFLEQNNIYPEAFDNQIIQDAKPLNSGISGALKGLSHGLDIVIKPQILTKDFKDNLNAILDKSQEIEHKLVSESDDCFTDFPRKEVLGATLAKAFGLEMPDTQLVMIKEDEYASVQLYMHTATPMAKKSDLAPYELDLNSVKRTFFLHLVTENIDGHTGNIMLAPFKGEEDSLAEFSVIPIDYGLIFPRNDSIYPLETNLFKKGFYEFIQSRTINVKTDLKPILQNLTEEKKGDLHKMMKDHEKRLFEHNLKALEILSQGPESKLKVHEFLDKFIETALTLEKK